MAVIKGKHGGARPGAGRPRTAPTPTEMWQILRQIENRLARMEREENSSLILRQLAEVRRQLGMTSLHEVPRSNRRRPLGLDP